MSKNNQLPKIDLDLINKDNIDLISIFTEVGFAYVKIPDSISESSINEIYELYLKFHQQSINEKSKYPFTGSTGFTDRRQDDSPKQLENLYQNLDQPVTFLDNNNFKQTMNKLYNSLAVPLIKATLNYYELNDHFEEIVENNLLTVLSSYYDGINPDKYQWGIPPHKDFGLLTLLYIKSKGLQVQINEKWIPIDPIPGYIVVNWGNAFALMLGCESAIHAVLPREQERLSFGLFIDGELSKPLRDYQNSRNVLYPTYQEYLTESLKNFKKQK